MYAPISLFVYNRLEETTQTVNALKKNYLAQESDLFIFSDGPRSIRDEDSVNSVRLYVNKIKGFKKVTIYESESNNGLAVSIVSGITKILNKYKNVIVLEDDIVTSNIFLRYMNECLNYYEDKPEVMQISGFMFPIDDTLLPDTFYYPANTCWGWSTWKSSWIKYIDNVDLITKSLKEKKISWRMFNSMQGNEFKKQLIRNKKGKLKTWAVKWHASILINEGKVVHPKTSLVMNVGFAGDGENCKKGESQGALNNDLLLNIKDAEYKSNHLALSRLKVHFKKRYSLLNKVRIRLINLFT